MLRRGCSKVGRSCSCWDMSRGQCRCTHSSLFQDSCLQQPRSVTSQESHTGSTLQLPHAQQKNLYYLLHGDFTSAATPRAVPPGSCPQSPPLLPSSVAARTPACPACETPETVYLTSIQFSCWETLMFSWRKISFEQLHHKDLCQGILFQVKSPLKNQHLEAKGKASARWPLSSSLRQLKETQQVWNWKARKI